MSSPSSKRSAGDLAASSAAPAARAFADLYVNSDASSSDEDAEDFFTSPFFPEAIAAASGSKGLNGSPAFHQPPGAADPRAAVSSLASSTGTHAKSDPSAQGRAHRREQQFLRDALSSKGGVNKLRTVNPVKHGPDLRGSRGVAAFDLDVTCTVGRMALVYANGKLYFIRMSLSMHHFAVSLLWLLDKPTLLLDAACAQHQPPRKCGSKTCPATGSSWHTPSRNISAYSC